ncbi:hypothetical protein IQ07DRAFT_676541 [Pyrenochaeta sp. DS3sAY3a]|nr:hypothetical protein IQ07DRAFT_676541 [Pyrenochaeta sp. DS3sAY3a]
MAFLAVLRQIAQYLPSFLSSETQHTNQNAETLSGMDIGIFCVMCGGPFDINGDIYHIDSEDERFRWLFNYRLLGFTEDVINHQLSSQPVEFKNYSDDEDVFLSERAYYSINHSSCFNVPGITSESDAWFNVLRESSQARAALFPLHESCISIGCRVIDRTRVHKLPFDRMSSLVILNDVLQLCRLETKVGRSDSKMDILNLCEAPGGLGPRSVLALTKLEMWKGTYEKFYTNPLDIPNLIPFTLSILEETPADSHWSMSRVTSRHRGFEELPNELLDQICSYLPVSSVISLARTCKLLALRALNGTFWRTRLIDGSLVPHMWDLDNAVFNESAMRTNRNWGRVAKILSQRRLPMDQIDWRLKDIPDGLWNRCRVWSIVEKAAMEYFAREV